LLYSQVSALAPVEDDRIVNDATISRTDGDAGSYSLLASSKSSKSVDQATGVGDIPLSDSRSLSAANQAHHHARWLVNLGTAEEPRYAVGINLRAQTGLISSWLNCDLGSRVVVNNPTSIHCGPAPLDLIIEGYQELIDAVRWEIVLYTRPSRPYEVLQIGTGTDNRSRLAMGRGQCTVNTQQSAVTPGTSANVAVTSANVRWIDSATYPTKFPFNVVSAGEVMSCTAITGTTLSQTMTLTRGIHGVTKTIPAGSDVEIWRAPVLAL
jgi:hypothetical protein